MRKILFLRNNSCYTFVQICIVHFLVRNCGCSSVGPIFRTSLWRRRYCVFSSISKAVAEKVEAGEVVELCDVSMAILMAIL